VIGSKFGFEKVMDMYLPFKQSHKYLPMDHKINRPITNQELPFSESIRGKGLPLITSK